MFSILQSVHFELYSLIDFLVTYHYYYCYINTVYFINAAGICSFYTRTHTHVQTLSVTV